MADVEITQITYVTTGAESGATVIGTFEAGKGAFLRYGVGNDGVAEGYIALGNAFVTPGDGACGAAIRRSTAGNPQTRMTGIGNAFDEILIYDDGAAGTLDVSGAVSMSATALTVDFASVIADVTIEVTVFSGPETVSAELFEASADAGSVSGLAFQPNLVLFSSTQIGTLGGTSGSSGSTNYYIGFAADNTVAGVIEQGGMGSRFSSNRANLVDESLGPDSTGGGAVLLDVTAFNADGFSMSGSAHPVMGIAIQTAGDVAVKNHEKGSGVTTGQTQSLPAAGFSDVGFIAMLSMMTPALDTASSGYASYSYGVMTSDSQRVLFAQRDAGQQQQYPDDGAIVIGEDGSANTVRGELDAVGSSPTITWVDASAVTVQSRVLYVATANDGFSYTPMLVTG